MNRFLTALTVLLSLTACTSLPPSTSVAEPAITPLRDSSLALFSHNQPSGLPERWTPLILFRTKKQTQYQLVAESDNATVLHAYAPSASSGLMQYVSINPLVEPWLNWSWKVGSIVQTAADGQAGTEDSPARIILGFDGDKDTLPFADQILFETARVFTGYDFPYATLMYIWDSNTPLGTVLTSKRSSRIKMMVVANSAKGIGEWQEFTRNIVEDFQFAFGEKPGQLIGVGVLTDTDNLGETVEAWYGDIRLQRDRK